MKYQTSDFSEHRVRAAVAQAGIGIWEHNLATDEVIWNEQMHRLYGHEPIFEPRLASIWVDSLHPEDRERAIAEFEQAAVGHDAYQSCYRIVRPNGEVRHVQSTAIYEVSDEGQPRYWGTEWDVTTVGTIGGTTSTSNGHSAFSKTGSSSDVGLETDPITGLPNRMRLYEVLRQSAQDAQSIALAQLDLAEFRNVNEEFGVEVGDLLLARVATALTDLASGSASLFRSGSGEFTFIVNNPTELSLQRFAHAAIEAVQRTAKELQPSLSGVVQLGIVQATSPDYGPRLLALSEAALIQAKRQNVPIVFYDEALIADIASRKLAKKDLRRALEHEEIEPFYQVQIDGRTGAVVGLEALARWRHPDKGILPPSAFFPVADAHGLTATVDDLMLRRVMRDRTEWERQGLSVPRIALNISAMRLHDQSLLETLQNDSSQYSNLAFELVETVYFDGICDEVLGRLNAIRSLGIEIEIDDFGSGHASLVSLLKIHPDRLKIDRHLINDIVNSVQQREVVRAIIQIAGTLNIGVVAEGVETAEQAVLLTEMGCEVLQGYFFGRPEAAADVVTRLRGRVAQSI